MNEKEISEIRRRFKAEKSNITSVRGCYVNEKREIIAEFNQSLALIPEAEAEEILSIIKRTLSGTIGKNLIDIEFSTRQVLESEDHKLLMTLRDAAIGDDIAVNGFYRKVIDSLKIEGNYLILLSCDKYDVPSYAKDGKKDEDSSSSFTYYLCSICPVKMTKPALGYYINENRLCSIGSDWIVAAPELGFMFPTFDNRSANIYNALYYTRNTSDSHKEFTDAVFGSEIPTPAAVQKETFKTILEEAVSDDCSYEVAAEMHAKICDITEEHKANKEEPLAITKNTVKEVLQTCGVPEERVKAFEEKYDVEFGAETELNPAVILNTKQFEIQTPDIKISVNPERTDLVETRVIDGVKYIMIRADENVEVNGVNIKIS